MNVIIANTQCGQRRIKHTKNCENGAQKNCHILTLRAPFAT